MARRGRPAFAWASRWPAGCSPFAPATARTWRRRPSFPGRIRGTTGPRPRTSRRPCSAPGARSPRSCSRAVTSSGPLRRPPSRVPEYASALNEVQSLGSATSTTRTAEQTVIGKFWAPPIQNFWNQIAQTVAASNHADLPTAARLFATLDLSIADSTIAFYDAKYAYQLWRPVTAIRLADSDGNSQTSGDPNWLPLAGNTPAGSVLPRCPQHDQRGRSRSARALLRRPPALLDHLSRPPGHHAVVHQLQRCGAGSRSQQDLRRRPHAARSPGRTGVSAGTWRASCCTTHFCPPAASRALSSGRSSNRQPRGGRVLDRRLGTDSASIPHQKGPLP